MKCFVAHLGIVEQYFYYHHYIFEKWCTTNLCSTENFKECESVNPISFLLPSSKINNLSRVLEYSNLSSVNF